MTTGGLLTIVLAYPDGWTETWCPPAGATRESLQAAGLQLLGLAGVAQAALDGIHAPEDLPAGAISPAAGPEPALADLARAPKSAIGATVPAGAAALPDSAPLASAPSGPAAQRRRPPRRKPNDEAPQP